MTGNNRSIDCKRMDTISALQGALRPMAERVSTKLPFWIETPDGDIESEWCGDCARYKLRNLRRKDKKRREDYYLGGGYRCEEEHFLFCEGCGVRLEISLLESGVLSELDQYETFGFSTHAETDAFEIEEMLSAVSYQNETSKLRDKVIALAENFITQAATS